MLKINAKIIVKLKFNLEYNTSKIHSSDSIKKN